MSFPHIISRKSSVGVAPAICRPGPSVVNRNGMDPGLRPAGETAHKNVAVTDGKIRATEDFGFIRHDLKKQKLLPEITGPKIKGFEKG